MSVVDVLDAFYNARLTLPPLGKGPLEGLRFAAKEAFSVKGEVTSGGNPDWLATHGPAQDTAAVIEQLRRAGATLTGKTHTDELMYGLNGENVHYGTPLNPRAPDRIPGGSSSGSAAAVAGNLVDFAIGTDTGGSVRIPASYCGVYGFRPSHGRTDLTGTIPLAQSFDTVGWFTRTPELLRTIGQVLLKGPARATSFARAIVAEDVLALVDGDVRPVMNDALERIGSCFPEFKRQDVVPDGTDGWMEGFRIIQGYEIWQNFGSWISSVHPRFGPGVRERFQWTATITAEERDFWWCRRKEWTRLFQDMVGPDTVVIMPTAPGVAPLRNTPIEQLNAFRLRVLRMTAIAGMTGSAQVTLPWVEYHGLPLGLSLLSVSGTDEALLDLVCALTAVFHASRR